MKSIAIISDFICPWCYIAHARLDRLIKEHDLSKHIQIVPMSYILYRDIPPEGMPIEVSSVKKRPGVGRVLRDEARSEGIIIDYERIKLVSQTALAHRLIDHTVSVEGKWALSLGIFEAYFSLGSDIGDVDVLQGIASQVFQKEVSLDRVFDPYKDKPSLDLTGHYPSHINQVPTLMVSEYLVLPGLQSSEVWLRYLDRIIRM